MKKRRILVGIDEVGRGAIAGPLVIAGVVGTLDKKNKSLVEGIKDSKKLTPFQRENWLRKLKKSDWQFFSVSVSSQFIDRFGIKKALIEGVRKILKKIKIKPDLVLLDGGLEAPPNYSQKVIIKGDEKNPLIAAASIYGKIKRDKLMIRLERKYRYGFDKHKGYGTKEHFLFLKKKGLSEIHRRSFLKRLLRKN